MRPWPCAAVRGARSALHGFLVICVLDGSWADGDAPESPRERVLSSEREGAPLRGRSYPARQGKAIQ